MRRGSWRPIGGLIGVWLLQACAAAPSPTPVAVAPPSPIDPADSIKVALPDIPDRHFNIVDFGGVADGKTLNTDAFVKAVDAIKAAGGGHLEIPAGTFLTLSFQFASKMDLHLDAGAMIKAPDSITAWGLPDPNTASQQDVDAFGPGAVIYGSNLTDIAITGSGTIDGSGQLFWIWSDKAARRYPPDRLIYPRPRLISFRTCKRVHVDGVTLENAPMYHLSVGTRSEDILVENVRVFAPGDAPNTDAIDPGGTRIIVRNCEIDTGDDHVAIQGGSHDVLIEDLTCLHGHGISIGSSTTGGVSHVFVRRCTFDGSDNGLRIKSVRGRGGEVHDIHYSDITMKNVERPFDINMLYNGNANAPTDVGPRYASGNPRNIPNFHDIFVTNLTVTRSPVAGRILGVPENPANNITLTNVSIQADRGFVIQDAKDIKFVNVKLDIAVGPPMVTDNAQVEWEK
jgi:polygalacturonase